tara:strand:- start:326 stop:493 length:168 start_codon:yes stop_codon:yes gene_type:complete
MPDKFEITDKEKSSTTGETQLEFFQRLADFVNARLAEIEKLQGDVDDLKSDSPNT